MFIGRTNPEAETPILWPPHVELTHWKRPWCWEGLGAGGEGDNRGRDGWMASPTQWTWVWVNSRSWWWTGRPGVLQFMGSQRIGHDWATELNWTELMFRKTEWLGQLYTGSQRLYQNSSLLTQRHLKKKKWCTIINYKQESALSSETNWMVVYPSKCPVSWFLLSFSCPIPQNKEISKNYFM